jgi:uncharacterized glyoxalase superfamily protein PhnB
MAASIASYLDTPLILMIIGGLATVVLGYKSSQYKKKPPPLWISRCTVTAGIAILISGVWSSIDQAKFQKKLLALQTGEGSFAHAEITLAKDPIADYLQFDVVHQGEFPIYELTISITDEDLLKELFHKAKHKKMPLTLQYLNQAKRTLPTIATFGPVNNIISDIAAYRMPSNLIDRNFSIEITSKYDRLNQILHVHRNPDGRLTFDNMVKRGDKIIYSIGDSSYFERQAAAYPQEALNYKWTLKNQGESITVMLIEGRWYGFDAAGKLVNP